MLSSDDHNRPKTGAVGRPGDNDNDDDERDDNDSLLARWGTQIVMIVHAKKGCKG